MVVQQLYASTRMSPPPSHTVARRCKFGGLMTVSGLLNLGLAICYADYMYTESRADRSCSAEKCCNEVVGAESPQQRSQSRGWVAGVGR